MSLFGSVLRPWIVVIMGGIFYCYQFVLRVSPNVMTDELMLAFGIDAGLLALVVSVYYYGYSSMQIPLGILMDRFGARRIIAAAAMTCGIATFLFSISESSICASIARFFIGVGSACGYLGTLKLGTQWFPRHKMPHVVGLTMLLGTTGASIGTLPLEYLIGVLGWYRALGMLSIFGVVLGFLILLVIGKNPPNSTTLPKGHQFFDDFFVIIKNPQAWLISIFAMLMYVPLTVIGDLWGVSFLEQKYALPERLSSIAVISMFVGVGLGGPFFAWVTSYWGSRKKPMVLGAFVTTVIYQMILFLPNVNFTVICLLFFLAGIFFNGQCIAFSSICEVMPEHASGVAVGFLNMLVMASGLIFLPIVGRILVALWDGTVVNNVPVYSASSFQMALTVIPLCLVLAVILTFFIKDTYEHVRS